MYLFICDGVPYFIEKDRDTYLDFVGIADEQFVCEHETDAIRKHLLMSLGIMD